MTTFAAVIPVIDEVAAIGDVVRSLHAVGACCVIVVDGGSRDGTPEVARAAGALVVAEPRRGYGRACLSGAEVALDPGRSGHRHERIGFLDGDGSCTAADVRSLVDALDDADVVFGRRVASRVERGALPIQARLGNALVTAVLGLRTGRRIHDLAPTKALRATALRALDLDAAGYAWTVQLVARVLGDPGLRAREVAVGFRVRRGGQSKVSGSWPASLRAGRQMLAAAIAETRPRPVLSLMAKAPRAGHAKTRLAADLGDEATAALWTAALCDSAANALGAATVVGARPTVMAADARDVEPLVDLLGDRWAVRPQRRPGLSSALMEVFVGAHDAGTDRAMAVAGDIPQLPPDELVQAWRELDRSPTAAVLGPSSDGGYHYVALRWDPTPRWWPRAVRRRRARRFARRLERVFRDADGGRSVRRATTDGLIRSGWDPVIRPTWLDLDTVEDLRALDGQLSTDGRWAPRTRAWLSAHREVVAATDP